MVRADKIDKTSFQIKLVRTVFFTMFVVVFASATKKMKQVSEKMHSCVLCVCFRPCMIPYWSIVCLRKSDFQNGFAYLVSSARAHIGPYGPKVTNMGPYVPVWQKTLVSLMYWPRIGKHRSGWVSQPVGQRSLLMRGTRCRWG